MELRQTEAKRIKALYERDYRHGPDEWSYLWHPRNRVSYMLRHIREHAVIEGLNRNSILLSDAKILDLGCGDGDLLAFLATLGAQQGQMTGVDLVPGRIETARHRVPNAKLLVQDVASFREPDATYDCIAVFTVFSSIRDKEVRATIARNIQSMLKPGGWLLWFDLCVPNSNPERAQGMSSADVAQLFAGLSRRFEKKMFSSLALPFIVRGHRTIATLLEAAPFGRRTNLFALFQKPAV